MQNRTIIAMCGIPGVGKSTISRLLHEIHGFAVISSDDIRERRPLDAVYFPHDGGALDELFYREIRNHLDSGQPFIVDATYHTREKRKRLLALGRDFGYEVTWCYCTATEEVVIGRLRDQEQSGAKRFHSPIPELVTMYLETCEPPDSDGGEGLVVAICSEDFSPWDTTGDRRSLRSLLDMRFRFGTAESQAVLQGECD